MQGITHEDKIQSSAAGAAGVAGVASSLVPLSLLFSCPAPAVTLCLLGSPRLKWVRKVK